MKLTNLMENHSIMDLINSCLAKNKKKRSAKSAETILVGWRKLMPFYYAAAIIIVFLIAFFA